MIVSAEPGIMHLESHQPGYTLVRDDDLHKRSEVEAFMHDLAEADRVFHHTDAFTLAEKAIKDQIEKQQNTDAGVSSSDEQVATAQTLDETSTDSDGSTTKGSNGDNNTVNL